MSVQNFKKELEPMNHLIESRNCTKDDLIELHIEDVMGITLIDPKAERKRLRKRGRGKVC